MKNFKLFILFIAIFLSTNQGFAIDKAITNYHKDVKCIVNNYHAPIDSARGIKKAHLSASLGALGFVNALEFLMLVGSQPALAALDLILLSIFSFLAIHFAIQGMYYSNKAGTNNNNLATVGIFFALLNFELIGLYKLLSS